MWTDIDSIGRITSLHPDIGILLDYSGLFGSGSFIAPYDIIIDAINVARQTQASVIMNFFGVTVGIDPGITIDVFCNQFASVFTFHLI